MAFKPENISKEHVLSAINKIEQEQIDLLPSTRWLVEINGKTYPPKEIMRYAHEQMNGEKIWRNGGGKATNKFLEEMGFKIADKSIDPLRELVAKYKVHARKFGLEGEIYKWELLQQYKGRPDINAENFYEEIKGINFFNLIYPVGIAVIHHIAKDRTEAYKACFKVLFDESKSLAERIKYFNEETLKIYRELVPEERFSHHQDERTIATFLTYHDPTLYTFYKDSFYQKLCKLIGIKSKKKGEKYVHYLQLVNDFIDDYIIGDEELENLVSQQPQSNLFDDKNHKILAQDILYQTLDKQVGESKSYWRIGTSDGTDSYWDFMLSNNKICIGWSDIGDLNELDIKHKRDVEDLLRSKGHYAGDNRTLSRKAGEIFSFYNELKIGDIVLAQDGAQVLGIGIISDEYTYEKEEDFSHQFGVEWKVKNPKLVNNEGLRTTVYRLTDMAVRKQVNTLLDLQPENDFHKDDKMNIPLNQILFGPPGTGKTFATIHKSIEIANPSFDLSKPRHEVKKEFDRLLQDGQIVFTTFHQSMSYEDFIEGIKPLKPLDEKSGNVYYDVVPGIFKRLCRKAETPPNPAFATAYKKLLAELEIANEIHLVANDEPFTILTSENGIDLDVKSDSYIKNISREGLEYVSKSGKYIGKWGVYYRSIFQYLKDKFEYQSNNKTKLLNHVLIIDEINRGNISQIFGELITLIEEDKRQGNNEALEVVLPYSKEKFGIPKNLYIIGTMNTADRSVEALDAALRRRFYFEEIRPKPELISPDQLLQKLWIENVDLDWTDEKWKTLETTFLKFTGGTIINRNEYERLEEKVFTPDFDLGISGTITFSGLNLELLLNIINKRIEKLLDKDHQIGHSYFMSVYSYNDLKDAFYNKLIPLLQEYFYGDYGKIGLVLGKGFVRKVEMNNSETIFADFDYESRSDLDQREVYEIIDYRNSQNKHLIRIESGAGDIKIENVQFEEAVKLLMNLPLN